MKGEGSVQYRVKYMWYNGEVLMAFVSKCKFKLRKKPRNANSGFRQIESLSLYL